MYYNTTSLQGPTLFDSIRTAINQDELILEYFRKYPDSLFSPCDIWKSLFPDGKVPITSIRRSINTITKDGLLIKTDQYKNGIYGKKCFMWKLKTA